MKTENTSLIVLKEVGNMAGWNEEIKKELGFCGKNVFIGHNVIFTNPKEVFLGDNVRIDPFCLITTQLVVDNYVQICSHTVLGGGAQHKITLGKWNFIGYGSKLFCASEDYSGEFGPVNEFWGKNKIFRGDITFNDYCGVASDVIVMPGVTLPVGCTIGASSFVYTKSELKEWSVFLGNPLKFHKERFKDNIIRLANSPEFLKDRWRKKCVKVICCYFGDRRSDFNTPKDIKEYLRISIKNEVEIENGVETDVILVNNDVGNKEGNDFLKQYDGLNTKNGKIILETRENKGGSFGAYYDMFRKYKDDYKYWFFCEDDVLVYKEKYMLDFVNYIESDNSIGFVCLAPISFRNNPAHSGGGCGLTTRENFLLANSNEYMEEYMDKIENGSDYNDLQNLEVQFTNVYVQNGMKLKNHPKYSPVCVNHRKVKAHQNYLTEKTEKLEYIYKVGN